MRTDPWGQLGIPEAKDTVSARRVSESARWNFYWARDCESRCLLVLRHHLETIPRLPRLEGIELILEKAKGNVMASLILRLVDSTQRDIFHRLCLDIIETAGAARTEDEALTVTVARTWRWHHLLRGGSNGLLSPQEQMGLMAELYVLEAHCLVALPAKTALAAWQGPLGAAKDFRSGRTAVEVKAKGRGERPEVEVNSLHQLDQVGLTNLFLSLAVFGPAKLDQEGGITVAEVAIRLMERLRSEGEELAEQFGALLAAAGFRFEDDYSDFQWVGGEKSLYRVEGLFPRLVPAMMPAGITRARYIINLTECGPHIVPPSSLTAAWAGSDRAP